MTSYRNFHSLLTIVTIVSIFMIIASLASKTLSLSSVISYPNTSALQLSKNVSTFAGETDGNQDGSLANARFANLLGMCIDYGIDGDTIYVTDSINKNIRKITPSGNVTTLVSNLTYEPTLIVIDPKTKNLFFCESEGGEDSGNVVQRICKRTPEGIITTFAGSTGGYVNGQGTSAKFYQISGIAIAEDGTLFVSDLFNHVIRKVTSTGLVSTFAGTGVPGNLNASTPLQATFYAPAGIMLTKEGDIIVTDFINNNVRKISKNGIVTTIAGYTGATSLGEYNSEESARYVDGNGSSARFKGIALGAIDKDGNIVVNDAFNYRIRLIKLNGDVSTIAGSGVQGYADGNGTSAQFASLTGIALGNSSNYILVSDPLNKRIRKIV